MSFSVEYGPQGSRKQWKGKLREIYPAYEQLRASGEKNIEIKDSNGDAMDPHQFYLDVVLGGVTVRSSRTYL